MGNRKRRADRTYKDLKQKQKAGIADGMFQKTCDYYREHGRMPEGEDCEKIAGQIYQRVKGIAEKAAFDEILLRPIFYDLQLPWLIVADLPDIMT